MDREKQSGIACLILALLLAALAIKTSCKCTPEAGLQSVCWKDGAAVYNPTNCTSEELRWPEAPITVFVSDDATLDQQAGQTVKNCVDSINTDVGFQLLSFEPNGLIRVFWGATANSGVMHRKRGGAIIANIYMGGTGDVTSYIVLRQLLYRAIGLAPDDFGMSIMHQPINLSVGSINQQRLTDHDRSLLRALYRGQQ